MGAGHREVETVKPARFGLLRRSVFRSSLRGTARHPQQLTVDPTLDVLLIAKYFTLNAKILCEVLLSHTHTIIIIIINTEGRRTLLEVTDMFLGYVYTHLQNQVV